MNVTEEITKIMANRAKNMSAADIDTQLLDITKEDLFNELRAVFPEITDISINEAIRELDSKGYVALVTADIISFKKILINE